MSKYILLEHLNDKRILAIPEAIYVPLDGYHEAGEIDVCEADFGHHYREWGEYLGISRFGSTLLKAPRKSIQNRRTYVTLDLYLARFVPSPGGRRYFQFIRGKNLSEVYAVKREEGPLLHQEDNRIHMPSGTVDFTASFLVALHVDPQGSLSLEKCGELEVTLSTLFRTDHIPDLALRGKHFVASRSYHKQVH